MSSPISDYSAPKVSVIMPVYNTELYVERAMISLMEQTLDDVQFIIIDDGSKDNSLSIIKEVITRYPSRKDQITLISRENRGVAATRAQGMELATGEYVIHLDSDDWVERDWLEAMHTKAVQDNADVVICDYSLIYKHGKKKVTQIVFDAGEECIISLFKNEICNANWNKLVKLKTIKENNIIYVENIDMGEDLLMSLKILFFSEKVSKISSSLYNYNQVNSNSLTYSYTEKAIMDLKSVVALVERFLCENNASNRVVLAINYLKINVKLAILVHSSDYLEKRSSIWTYPESNRYILMSRKFFRLKLYYISYIFKLDKFYKF